MLAVNEVVCYDLQPVDLIVPSVELVLQYILMKAFRESSPTSSRVAAIRTRLRLYPNMRPQCMRIRVDIPVLERMDDILRRLCRSKPTNGGGDGTSRQNCRSISQLLGLEVGVICKLLLINSLATYLWRFITQGNVLTI